MKKLRKLQALDRLDMAKSPGINIQKWETDERRNQNDEA
jgi:hypothetical protein